MMRRNLPNPFAVAALAVGIGAVGAMFQLLYGVLLRPVPYEEPERLVELRLQSVAPVYSRRQIDDLRTLPAFERLGAYTLDVFTLALPAEPVQVPSGWATGTLFQTLRLRPALGRLLDEDDSRPSANPVALLTHAFWRDAFGGDVDAVGRTLDIVGEDGVVRAHEIVGVLPEAIGHPFSGTSVWVPVTVDPTAADYGAKNANLHAIGRLAPGHDLESAQALVTPMVKDWVDRMPPGTFSTPERRATYRAGLDATVIGLARFLSADSAPLMWGLFAFALFLLAISCANVANVEVARGIRRAREFGIRYQLGASRSRLIALVLRESATLALAGAGGGLLLMAALSSGMRAYLPIEIAPELGILGVPALVAVVVTALLVTLALGAAGGLLSVEARALGELQGGRVAPRRRFIAERSLVAISACMTVALTLGAGLMFRTVRAVAREDPGFAVNGLVSIEITPSVSDPDRAYALWRSLAASIRERTDVREVGLAYSLPLTGSSRVTSFRFADHPTIPREESQLVGFQIASPGYVETLGLRLVDGRAFTADDVAQAPGVAIVNVAFAREYFGGASPVGFSIGADGEDAIEIVGLVSDVRHTGLDADPEPRLYYPVEQFAPRALTLVARTEQSPGIIARAVRDQLAILDPFAVVTRADRYADIMRASMRVRTQLFDVLWIFAAFGLFLSALGVFGTMHGWLGQRRREIGVRSALGASPARIARWVAMTAAVPMALGSIAGLAIAIAGGRALSILLYGVRPWDPAAIAAVLLLQLVVTAVTLGHPLRQAARTQPSRVLNKID